MPPGECARTKRRFLDLLGAVRPFKVIVTQRRRRRWAAAAARARAHAAGAVVLRTVVRDAVIQTAVVGRRLERSAPF